MAQEVTLSVIYSGSEDHIRLERASDFYIPDDSSIPLPKYKFEWLLNCSYFSDSLKGVKYIEIDPRSNFVTLSDKSFAALKLIPIVIPEGSEITAETIEDQAEGNYNLLSFFETSALPQSSHDEYIGDVIPMEDIRDALGNPVFSF